MFPNIELSIIIHKCRIVSLSLERLCIAAPLIIIRYGTSCGCSYETAAAQSGFLDSLQKKVAKQLFRGFEKKSFLGADFISKMSDAEDLSALMDTVDNVGHILNGWKWLDIALCEDWQSDFDNPYNFRQHSFSDRMYLALSKRYGENEKSGYYYPTANILPALDKSHEPMIIVLTSLHCNTNGNKGIACGLNNLQKLRDGEPLGGKSRAEDDFADMDDDDDDFLS